MYLCVCLQSVHMSTSILVQVYANGMHYETISKCCYESFMVIENYGYISPKVSLEKQNQLVSKNLQCDLLSLELV